MSFSLMRLGDIGNNKGFPFLTGEIEFIICSGLSWDRSAEIPSEPPLPPMKDDIPDDPKLYVISTATAWAQEQDKDP